MKERNYFLYVGNAYPHKNLERAIKALYLLNRNSEKKYLLKIACARNVFTEKLEALIKKNKAEKYVELLGFVPDEKIIKIYKNSLGFLFPSLSEGFGLPGIEAMKIGTLLVASDIPVFREVYKDYAIYFDPYSANAIYKSLREVINMPKSVRDQKIREAQKFVKKYSWSKMAEETLDVYQNIFLE